MNETKTKNGLFSQLRDVVKTINLSSTFMASIVLAGLAGAFAGTYVSYRNDNKNMSVSEAISAVLESRSLTYIMVISTVVPIAYLMLKYLERGVNYGEKKDVEYMNNVNRIKIIRENISIDQEIDKLLDIERSRKGTGDYEKDSEHLKEEILSEVSLYIRNTTRSEVSNMLIEEFSDLKKSRTNELLIEKELARSYERLENEIRNLLRRGNLNLVIGILTSVAPLGLLMFSLQYTGESINNFLFKYIPRISITIFVEVFSFFFLRLYRNSLVDIKYYQNELTNIEFKIMSIRLIMKEDNKELLTSVINELIKTERNFIVKSDENIVTTALVEKENNKDKSYAENLKTVIDSFTNLMNKK